MRPLILLPLALAACQQQPTETAGNNAADATAPIGMGPSQLRLIELPEGQQHGVFLRAIRDGNAPCQGVTESHRQPDVDGNPVFSVRCTDGPAYTIAVDRNGTALVTKVSADRR